MSFSFLGGFAIAGHMRNTMMMRDFIFCYAVIPDTVQAMHLNSRAILKLRSLKYNGSGA